MLVFHKSIGIDAMTPYADLLTLHGAWCRIERVVLRLLRT